MPSAYQTYACAHRGDNHCAPENTLPAFALALEKGAHQIEFDLQVTRDGELVALHDETVDRTTDGTGKISDLTLREAQALDAGSRKGKQFIGTRIPTFREILTLVPPGVLVNCQLYVTPEQVPLVVDQIKEFDLLEQCFLTANAAQIAAARAVEPDVLICNTEGERGPESDYPERTIAMGAQFLQIWGWADCLPAVVENLHRHGVTVNFFGTSEASMMRRLIEARVDYVLTDHLDLMHQTMAEYGLKPRV